MGIRNLHVFILAILMGHSFAAYSTSALIAINQIDDTKVQEIIELCYKYSNVKPVPENVGDPIEYTLKDQTLPDGRIGTKFMVKKIVKIGCCYATDGKACSEVGGSSSIDPELTAAGFVEGWATGLEIITFKDFQANRESVNQIVRNDISTTTTSILFRGKSYACIAGETEDACAIRWKIGAMLGGGKYVLSESGTPGVFTVMTSSVNAGTGVRTEIVGECGHYEKPWYWFGFGTADESDEWVKGCAQKTLLDTSEGSDILIGDGDLEARLGGTTRTTKVRSEYVRSRKEIASCSVDVDTEYCLDDEYGEISSDYIDLENCEHCRLRRSIHGNNESTWAENLSAGAEVIAAVGGGLFAPWMQYKSVKSQANAYRDAAIGTARECRLMQGDSVSQHYEFIQQNELASIYPDQATAPECNYGAYAGNQGLLSNGYGGFGGSSWSQYGHSNDFLASMQGRSNGYGLFDVTGMNRNPQLGLGVDYRGQNQFGGILGALLGGGNLSYDTQMPWSYGADRNNWRRSEFGFDQRYNDTSMGLMPWDRSGNRSGNYDWQNNRRNDSGSNNGSDFWAVQNSYDINNQASRMGSRLQQQALRQDAQRAYHNTTYDSGAYSSGTYNPRNAPQNLSIGASFRYGF